MSEKDRSGIVDVNRQGEERPVPAFPLAMHLPHPGEPLFPRYVEGEVTKWTTPELMKEWVTWQNWVLQQPDKKLLSCERFLWEDWQQHHESWREEDIVKIRQELNAIALEVREQGYGRVVEKYWHHLLQSSSSE